MKFSGNLFKIQAKISASAFILMGGICHLGAMDDDVSEKLGWRDRGNARFAQDLSEEDTEFVYEESTSPFRKGGKRDSLSSNDSPMPNAVRVRAAAKKTTVPLPDQFHEFRPKKAEGLRGKGTVSQSSVGQPEVLHEEFSPEKALRDELVQVFNSPQTPTVFSYDVYVEKKVGSPEHVDHVNLLLTDVPGRKTWMHGTPPQQLKAWLGKSTKKSPGTASRNSPEKSPVRQIRLEAEIVEAEIISPQYKKKSHRSPVYEAVGRNLFAAVKYDGMRLGDKFEPDEGALVTYGATRPVYEVEKQLERVQKSKRELQLLHEKSLADEAALANAKPVDITQTNQDLKYGVKLDEYEATALEDRPKFIKKLVKFYKDKPGFEDVTKDNVLDLLRSKMVGAMTRAHATMTQLCSAENASANSDKASKKKIIQAAEQGLSVIDTLEDVASKLIKEREAINSQLTSRVYREDVLTVLTGNNVLGTSADLKRMDPMALLEIITNQYLQSTRTIGNMSRAAELQAEKSVQDGNIIKELLAQKKAQDESMKALIENSNRMTMMLQESMRKEGSSSPQVLTERNDGLASKIGDLTLTTRKDNPLAKTGRARTQPGTATNGKSVFK